MKEKDAATPTDDVFSIEPFLRYCNAATDLHNCLEEITNGNEEHHQMVMISSKIRRLRSTTRDVREHLEKVAALAEHYPAHSNEIQQHAQRLRRAIASVVQAGRGTCFHSNGIPRQPTGALGNNTNVRLVAMATIRASMHKLQEKLKESS